MLATGWSLTWARLSSEHLPSENILAALPRSYFIQVSIQSTLSPLVISVFVGGIWVYLNAQWFKSVTGVRQWCCFGLFLAAVSWGVAGFVNKGGRHGGVLPEAIAGAVSIAIAGFTGGASRRYLQSVTTPSTWNRARPIAAFTLVLCFFVACMMRVVDARFASDVLPEAQALTDTPCWWLTGGIVPSPSSSSPATPDVRPGQADHCQVGGFYLGENSDWVYMIQRTCNSKEVPVLLDVRRESVQELAIFERAFSCTKKTQRAASTAPALIPSQRASPTAAASTLRSRLARSDPRG